MIELVYRYRLLWAWATVITTVTLWAWTNGWTWDS